LTHGIDRSNSEEMKEALTTLIDEILAESEKIINNYKFKTVRKIEKLILNGGSARMEGLKEYIEKKLNVKTSIANPWSKIIYPANLKKILEELGPEFSVAVGAAMREK
jgi:Tfp pilus assembly PilM family ATPase